MLQTAHRPCRAASRDPAAQRAGVSERRHSCPTCAVRRSLLLLRAPDGSPPPRRARHPREGLQMFLFAWVSSKKTGIETVYGAADSHGPKKLLLHTDRKSTRLNSSHLGISYAVFCLKKKK